MEKDKLGQDLGIGRGRVGVGGMLIFSPKGQLFAIEFYDSRGVHGTLKGPLEI